MAPRSRSDDRGVVLYLEAFALYRPMGAASDSAPGGACQAFRPPTRAETLMPGQFICHEQMKRMGSPHGASRVGQNARLAAKLTGFKIDIKPASNPGPDEPKEDAAIAEDAGADEE